MLHYTLMKCGFNQVQVIVSLQTDWSDLLKWEALMISFRNFNTGWKVEIQVTTQKGNFPAMCWFIWFIRLFGLFCNLYNLFVYFASTGFTAVQLYSCVIEATKVLMSLEFLVRAYVCNGASPNCKFFQLITSGSGDDFYWEWNAVEKGKKIYMI